MSSLNFNKFCHNGHFAQKQQMSEKLVAVKLDRIF